MVGQTPTEIFWHYQLVQVHLTWICMQSTATTGNRGFCPSQPLFSLTHMYSRIGDPLLSTNSSQRWCRTPQLVCKDTQTQHYNSIQLQAQRGTQPICDPASALLMVGGTNRVGLPPYHRISGKTSLKIGESILPRRRKRTAIIFLHVGDVCILKTKPLFIRAWQKKKKKKHKSQRHGSYSY